MVSPAFHIVRSVKNNTLCTLFIFLLIQDISCYIKVLSCWNISLLQLINQVYFYHWAQLLNFSLIIPIHHAIIIFYTWSMTVYLLHICRRKQIKPCKFIQFLITWNTIFQIFYSFINIFFSLKHFYSFALESF